jgi:hypothetical protein
MEVLKFTTTLDASGHLHLDIPTELSFGQVDVVLILNSIPSNTAQLSFCDFSDLTGRLQWQGVTLPGFSGQSPKAQ